MGLQEVNWILLDVQITSRETTFSRYEETSDDDDRVPGNAQILNFSH